MQKFLALTTLVAAAHAAELLTTADIDATVEQLVGPDFAAPDHGIDHGRDTAKAMGNNRDYYKKGHYSNEGAKYGTNATDAEVRPLCSVAGAPNIVDTQGPSDQCCRTYDYVNFEGNHRDWCLFATYNYATWATEPEKEYNLDQLGWQNDISSWKCGDKVQIEMCKHVGDTAVWNPSDRISANCTSGHQLNYDMGADSNVMDRLWVKPQGTPTEEEVCTATLYEHEGCQGPSFVIESNILTKPQKFSTLLQDDQWRGSWKHYDQAYDTLLAAGTIKSIMFKGADSGKRCVVELFQDGNFQSDSMTLKSDLAQGEACHQVPYISPITDKLPHGRWAGNVFTPDYEFADISGVHAVHIRQEYFP